MQISTVRRFPSVNASNTNRNLEYIIYKVFSGEKIACNFITQSWRYYTVISNRAKFHFLNSLKERLYYTFEICILERRH